MKKILIAAIAVSLVAVGVVSAGPSERHWKGYISRSEHYSPISYPRQVEIFEDRNGCQYLVVTSASSNASAHSVSITPRINSATLQPHCN
jgi:hypothetical protein